MSTSIAGLRVIHDEPGFFAIDKPSGLPVHRGYTGERVTVVDLLRPHLGGSVHPVHRLDRGTSGVLVIARSPEWARALGEAFTSRAVDKRYLALARGVVPDEVTVDHPVPNGPEKGAPRAEAKTRLQRLAMVRVDGSPLHEPRYSFVLAEPETGRFHQVRRHLAHLAHPILGDSDHGRPDHNRFLKERVGLARLALHAATLTFDRPDGGALSLEAPVPADLAGPIEALGIDVRGALAGVGLERLVSGGEGG